MPFAERNRKQPRAPHKPEETRPTPPEGHEEPVERERIADVYGGRDVRRRAEAELPPLPRDRERERERGKRRPVDRTSRGNESE